MTENGSAGGRTSACCMYSAVGCGVCALMLLVGIVAGYWWMGKQLSSMFDPGPVKSTGHYDFGYPEAAKAYIQLPDNAGRITYMHDLFRPGNVLGGDRGLRMMLAGKKKEWPLPYSHLEDVRVGVYWYSAKAGKGPYLRFYDATGEYVLDLGRREVAMICRDHGRVYVADYAYNDSEFVEPNRSWNSVADIQSANGKPALDVTSVISPENCRYLGTIVRSGNSLQFLAVKTAP